MAVYVQAVPPTLLTDTNEIAHWIDRYEDCYGDPLLMFSFWIHRRLVGFAHIVYFRAEQLAVVDYLVVDAAHRKNNVFFEFVVQIREYFQDRAWPIRWTAAEVALNHHPRPGADGSLLIRLLKLEGFRVVKAPYYQPLLAFNNRESEMPAVLLLAGDPELKRITRESYLKIVFTIYVKHYLRWYSIYPAHQQAERTERIRALEERIKKELGRAKWVELNGHDSLLKLGGSEEAQDTSLAERNLATNAVRASIPVLLALAGGVLPDPFRIALWSVLALGVVVGAVLWPSRKLRRLLWKEVRFFRKRE